MKRRVFLLGLDGGSWNLLDRLMAMGAMPHLQQACEGGVKAVLESTVPPVTPVAWTSLMTGVNPGKHGIFSFTRPRDDNAYASLPQNRLNMRVPTLFDYYREGGRVISLNLPMSYPATPINGIMVTGMMTPLLANARKEYPEGTLQRFRSAGIQYTIDPKFAEAQDLEPAAMFRQRFAAGPKFATYLGEITRQRMRAVHQLLVEESWELFVAVIAGTDRLQHLFWDQLLPPAGGEPEPQLVDYYRLVDGEIERLRAALQPEDCLLIVSDHGFGRLWGEISANQWLLENGFMVERSTRGSPLVWLRQLAHALGFSRNRLHRLLGQERASKLQLRAASMDWSRAKAFNGSPAGIRINLRGRETLGCVPPEDYEQVRTAIIERLTDLRDDAGETVVAQVFRREEVYAGDQLADAPDVLFLFREDRLYTAYPGGFTGRVFLPSPYKQGDHIMSGIFVACGGGIRRLEDRPEYHIWDVLPTIMHLNGRRVPAICDGRVLEEILAPGAGEVVHEPNWQQYLQAPQSLEYGQDDVDEINERLRALGYLND